MAENNENFSTMVLHEARELRVRMFAGKAHLALTKKRFDEFGEMSDTGRQDMVINGQHFKVDPTQLDKNTLQLAGEQQHRPTRRLGAAESKRGFRTTE